jgi:hypothetical protein
MTVELWAVITGLMRRTKVGQKKQPAEARAVTALFRRFYGASMAIHGELSMHLLNSSTRKLAIVAPQSPFSSWRLGNSMGPSPSIVAILCNEITCWVSLPPSATLVGFFCSRVGYPTSKDGSNGFFRPGVVGNTRVRAALCTIQCATR